MQIPGNSAYLKCQVGEDEATNGTLVPYSTSQYHSCPPSRLQQHSISYRVRWWAGPCGNPRYPRLCPTSAPAKEVCYPRVFRAAAAFAAFRVFRALAE